MANIQHGVVVELSSESDGVDVAMNTDSDDSSDDAFDGPAFLTTLDRYKVKRGRLTIPAPFVRENNLMQYLGDCTVIYTKHDDHRDFELVKYDNPRRPTVPPSHLTLKGDWKDFRRFNHLKYGCVLQFNLTLVPKEDGAGQAGGQGRGHGAGGQGRGHGGRQGRGHGASQGRGQAGVQGGGMSVVFNVVELV